MVLLNSCGRCFYPLARQFFCSLCCENLVHVVQVGVAFLLALEHANGLNVSPEENIELDRLVLDLLP